MTVKQGDNRMDNFLGKLSRLRHNFLHRGQPEPQMKAKLFKGQLLEEPEEKLEDEIVQNSAMLDLPEQLQIIQTVKAYIQNFVRPEASLDPSWISGYALQNEIFVAVGEETVSRCNVEIFFQEMDSGKRNLVFIVSLVRFAEEQWRVFQVKETELS